MTETAPPLFPAGGLVSYNSIFTTGGLMPGVSGRIPLTACPIVCRVVGLIMATIILTWFGQSEKRPLSPPEA